MDIFHFRNVFLSYHPEKNKSVDRNYAMVKKPSICGNIFCKRFGTYATSEDIRVINSNQYKIYLAMFAVKRIA